MKPLQIELNAFSHAIAQLEENAGWRAATNILLNSIERIEKERLEEVSEKQMLRDALNELKGEKGKPNIKANKIKSGDISSETERKLAESNAKKGDESCNGADLTDVEVKKKRRREPKLPQIKIDREQVCPLNKDGLPKDLVFKGYEDVVIQELIIKTDNVKYRREVFYSPSQRKTYLGELPQDVKDKGEYGPGIRSLIPILKTECNMSEKRVLGFFHNFDIVVSAAYLSQKWTGGYELFHKEKDELYRSGIANSQFVQIDDTSARVKGTNNYNQIVCSPLFTSYHTTETKDRLTVLSVLTNFAPSRYLYDSHAKELLEHFNLSDKTKAAINLQLPSDAILNEEDYKKYIANIKLGTLQTTRLTEACAIAYYQQQTEFPIIETLLADDAPQFKLLTRYLGLCWIHDGRHYKKLIPVVPAHQLALEAFRSEYWEYYTKLLKYKLIPTPEKKSMLSREFDRLFSSTSCYDDLSDRISKTLAKKKELLRVLDLPQLPLHNNGSEIEARVQARKRDVSYQTRSDKGTKIKDAFMTINQTCKKLGVSFYEYVLDRESGSYKLASLADLIVEKAKALLA